MHPQPLHQLRRASTPAVKPLSLLVALALLQGSAPAQAHQQQQVVFNVRSGTATSLTAMSGAVSVLKTGAGNQVLIGYNNYTGGTTISAGTLTLGNGLFNGWISGDVVDNGVLAVNGLLPTTLSGDISGSGALETMGWGGLILTGTNTYRGGTTIRAGTLTLGNGSTTGSITGNVLNNGALVVNRSNAVTLDGAISGSGTLYKMGANVLTLTGANSYTGLTTIAGGTLMLGNGGTSGSLKGDVLNAGVLAVNRSDAVTLGGVISGAGALVQLGAGVTTLTGANTYTGGTSLTQGTLALGSAGALGSSGSISFSGGALQFSAANHADYSSRFSTATGQAYALDTNGQTVTLATALRGSGNTLTKRGAGTLVLTAANSYSGGTTIAAGTLALGSGGSTGSLTGNVLNNGVLAVNRSNAITLAGNISGSGALTKQGAGTLTLTGSNSYTGGTSISAGTLAVGNGGNSGTLTGNVAINAGTTLAFNRADASSYSGALSGKGTLVKDGTGSLALASQAGFSGNTVVAAGELVSSGWIGAKVNVASGATLTASGQLGNLYVDGLLSAAAGVGSLAASSASFAAGSSYLWQMQDANGAAGTGYDWFSTSGSLTLSSNAGNQFNIVLQSLGADGTAGSLASGFDGNVNHSYVLMSSAAGISGYSADAFHIDSSGFTYGGLYNGSWSVASDGNVLSLNYVAVSAVPEPASYAMFLGGLSGIGMLARRRRNRAR